MPLSPPAHNWRDLGVQWHYPVDGGFLADVIYRPSRIGPGSVTAVVEEIRTILKLRNI